MIYANLKDCLLDLEKNGQLIRVKEPVDARLEMAAIHLRVNRMDGPAILFEKIKNCRFPAVSNIFGTTERCCFLFRGAQKKITDAFIFPESSSPTWKQQMQRLPAVWNVLKSTPRKNTFKGFKEIGLNELPQIVHWPNDSGASVSLPQILIRIPNSNIDSALESVSHNPVLLSGDRIHAGTEIGLLPTTDTYLWSSDVFEPLRLPTFSQISVFIGGSPANSIATSGLLPASVHPLVFAGIMNNRRYRYSFDSEGFFISNDADFILTGEWQQNETRIMGRLGTETGYYTLAPNGLVLKIHKVYARSNAIWQFTVPDKGIGEQSIIHSYILRLFSDVIKRDIPGLKDFRKVEAAGRGRLLLAVAELTSRKKNPGLMTIANRILSNPYLADTQYLWINATETGEQTVKDVPAFLKYALERVDWQSDIHFQVETNELTQPFTEESGKMNRGSAVFTISGSAKRNLGTEVPAFLRELQYFENPILAMPGIVVLQAPAFVSYEKAHLEMEALSDMLTVRSEDDSLQQFPLIVITENAEKMTNDFKNFLWSAFTKCAPLTDIYGVDSFFEKKHWGCKSSLIMDARRKPQYQEELKMPNEVLEGIAPIFDKGGSLYRFR